MRAYNMLEAKNQLSKLVEAVENGSEPEIIIARNGKPAARVVPLANRTAKIRLGLAKGRYVLDDFDRADDLIATLFRGGTD
jgi:prevent-host-death family protein